MQKITTPLDSLLHYFFLEIVGLLDISIHRMDRLIGLSVQLI